MSSSMALVHFAIFAIYVYTLYIIFFELTVPLVFQKRFEKFNPGHLKFLTVWGVIVQAVFFFLCVLNDIYGTNKIAPKKTSIFRRIKDYVHATYSFPLAMFVGITFWILMAVDRELVFPKVLEPYFPWWVNHIMHTMIMVTTVIEMFIAPREFPTRKYGYSGLYALMFTYLIWIHVIYYKSNAWVYPVMEVLSLPLRIGFLAMLCIFVGFLFYIGELIDHLIWGTIKTTAITAPKKKKSK